MIQIILDGAEAGCLIVASGTVLAFKKTTEGLRQVGGAFSSAKAAMAALIEAAKHG